MAHIAPSCPRHKVPTVVCRAERTAGELLKAGDTSLNPKPESLNLKLSEPGAVEQGGAEGRQLPVPQAGRATRQVALNRASQGLPGVVSRPPTQRPYRFRAFSVPDRTSFQAQRKLKASSHPQTPNPNWHPSGLDKSSFRPKSSCSRLEISSQDLKNN